MKALSKFLFARETAVYIVQWKNYHTLIDFSSAVCCTGEKQEALIVHSDVYPLLIYFSSFQFCSHTHIDIF